MAGAAIRVIGIDTSLRSSGVAVIEKPRQRDVPVEYESSSRRPLLRCRMFKSSISAGRPVTRTKPMSRRWKEIFFCKNVKTSVALGEPAEWRCGVALSGILTTSMASQGEAAVVGYGAASKSRCAKWSVAAVNKDIRTKMQETRLQ